MKENVLIIKENEDTLYQVRKENIETLKHEKKQCVKGFAISCTYIPSYYLPEQFYVLMKSGTKIILTKKQYNTIKKWFN